MSFKDPDLERRANELISLDEPLALIRRFSTLTRESGTPDERAAAEYIIDRLCALGIPVSVHNPELYLSVPERSQLRVIGPRLDNEEIASRPPSFARSTNGEEVTGELIYVSSTYAGGTADLFDTPMAAVSSAGAGTADPVAGRIVLTEGYSMPGTVLAFERRGAVAQIFIHPGDQIHEGICTPIWGAPTHESIGRKPRTPVVCIANPDGKRLASLASAGPVRVGVRTWLREGWSPCLLPVAEIRGTDDPDEFLLVHGHYDSWYVGVGDNATGDATLLELARILHGLRDHLKRSVRIAWWPGHSTGRYAGSTWYADAFADEIDEWCLGHINIDSPGCAGATAYEEVMWMAEAAELCIDSIADALGEPARGMRPLRAGDHSFNQIGPTAFYMLLSNIPQAERSARGYYAVGGCGGSTVWHTPADGPGVEDETILKRDLKVYLTTIVRALNAPLHPFDYAATATEIAAAVGGYQQQAAGAVDLKPILDDLRSLRSAIATWRAEAERRLPASPEDAALRRRLNGTLRRLARILVPLSYARGERFDHDPAVKLPPVPRLEAAALVAGSGPGIRPFVQTALLRERNKVRAMLRQALREVQSS
jgi:N-acetylated-alpha-linked acidic dipeptidase